ncbi:MAG: GtrA family protein [Muribaculaceae bacterium]
MKKQVKTTTIQLIKYGLVGISNSLLTLVVIFLCNDILNINLFIADILGYVVGLINSFIWNKNWVFKSHSNSVRIEMILFLIGFGICFGLQFLTVWGIVTFTTVKEMSVIGISAPAFGEYLAVCIGMVVYTICNYIYNRFVTFRQKA